MGQPDTRATQVLEAAVRTSTANWCAYMIALSARTKDTATCLQHLVTKVDAS